MRDSNEREGWDGRVLRAGRCRFKVDNPGPAAHPIDVKRVPTQRKGAWLRTFQGTTGEHLKDLIFRRRFGDNGTSAALHQEGCREDDPRAASGECAGK